MEDHVLCFYCQQPVDPRATGSYRRLVGWVRVREQGGTNSITLPSPPLAWAHGTCIDIVKLRGEKAWDQNSLF